MIVAIHQPNLFPWLGFFSKMACCDLFILLDTVPFTKNGYQNRVQLKGSCGAQWLTLPVLQRGRLGQLTNTVLIDQRQRWHKNHLRTFEMLYRRSSGYKYLIEPLEQLYNREVTLMIDFTIPGVMLIRDLLGIKTEVICASDVGATGQGTELLANLVQVVGGKIYLSGSSGRNYLDLSVFQQREIDVRYHFFKSFDYQQLFGSFLSGLSSLDYLFAEMPNLEKWINLCESGS